MGDRSAIEWTEATWNPVRGCSIVSEGCRNCYAVRQARRMDHPGGAYEGLTRDTPTGPKWNGQVRAVPRLLDQPLRWTRPRRIFVNSMSDLFHPGVPAAFVDEVFAVMALARRHVFQVLTKRPERMRGYLSSDRCEIVQAAADRILRNHRDVFSARFDWPLPNVWLGTSVEDQAAADERIPHLLQTPAAVRWLSCEPLLGPVDLTHFGECMGESLSALEEIVGFMERPRIDWVVAGGESGPGARPMHPAWARSLRDQCVEAGVPFFFKQWGAWSVVEDGASGARWVFGHVLMGRVGKKAAGRLLDGRTWDQYPEAPA